MDDWGDWSGSNVGGAGVSDNKAAKPDTDGWGTTNESSSKSDAGGWGISNDGGSRSAPSGKGCYNCGGQGHMSRDCPEPRKQGGGGRSCYNCGGEGHMSRDCPEPRKQGGGGGGGRSCYNCGGQGHMSRECPEPKKQGGARGSESGGGGGGGGGWDAPGDNNSKSDSGGWGSANENGSKNDADGWGSTKDNGSKSDSAGWGISDDNNSKSGSGTGGGCYNCGGQGHMSRDCPEPRKQRGGSGGGRSCYNCGGEGHMSRDCPEPKKQGGARGSESGGGGGGGGGWDAPGDNNSKSDAGGWGSTTDNGSKPDAIVGGEGERPAPYRPGELNLDEEAKLQVDNVGENFKRYKEQKVTCIPVNLIEPIEKFEDVIESKLLLENVKGLRYTEMTPIQKWAMPAIVRGYDLIGCAQTGSGKTAAFLLPILQAIMKSDLGEHNPDDDCQHPHCVIISPTRELAKQIYVQSNMLSKDSLVKSCYIYGQIATSHLKAQLSRGCHILVATLGRLKDFVQRGWIGFKNTKYVILDEGDRLVDDGFSGDLKTIFEHETMPPKEERQILFFSATFKKQVQLTAKEFLRDEFIFITVGRVGAANEDIKQEFLQASRADKKRELRKILNEVPETDKTIIFTQTKAAADMLAGFFNSLKLSATSIHGDRHQSQREEAINVFKRGDKRFLISSPVGNRGLDLPKVSLVINYDLPDNIDEYVHRIGRTGRAGHTGRAISFFDPDRDREVVPDLLKILEEAKQEIPSWLRETDNPVEHSDYVDNGTGSASLANDMEDDWGGSCSSAQPTAALQNNAPSVDADENWEESSSRVQPISVTNDDTSNGCSSNKRQATDEAGGPLKKVEKAIEPVFDQEW